MCSRFQPNYSSNWPRHCQWINTVAVTFQEKWRWLVDMWVTLLFLVPHILWSDRLLRCHSRALSTPATRVTSNPMGLRQHTCVPMKTTVDLEISITNNHPNITTHSPNYTHSSSVLFARCWLLSLLTIRRHTLRVIACPSTPVSNINRDRVG